MPLYDGFQFQPTLDALGRLRSKWPQRGWSWDTRLSCVASSIHVELTDEALSAAGLAFPQRWTVANITSAPPAVRGVADATGGIRPDQILFSMEPVLSTNLVYGLWWPWGDDVTISFRIGMAGPMLTREDFQARFRDVFGAVL